MVRVYFLQQRNFGIEERQSHDAKCHFYWAASHKFSSVPTINRIQLNQCPIAEELNGHLIITILGCIYLRL